MIRFRRSAASTEPQVRRSFGLFDRRLSSALLLGVVASLTGACSSNPSASFRFKLTVAVDTPAGRRSGSSVIEVSAFEQPGFDPSGRVERWRLRGDAVAIELPGQVTLFALLRLADPKRGDLASMAMRQFDPRFLNDRLESARRIARSGHVTAAVALAREDFPQLVLFTDPRDSKSIRIIDSGSTDPAIEKISIGVQLTDDPVSTGVLEKLPDFGAKSGFDEWLRTLSYGDPRIISSTDFEQGSK